MNKVSLAALVLISLLCVQAVFARTSSNSLIQTLDPKIFHAGIGCFLWPAGPDQQNYVFVDLNADLEAGPWMQVDGRVLKLEKIEGDWPTKTGRKSTLKFVADKTRVLLNLKNISTGPVGFSLEGTLSVVTGEKEQKMDISGGCSD